MANKTEQNLPFKEMTPHQKVVFILKVIVCAVSFGMIFPNVMGD